MSVVRNVFAVVLGQLVFSGVSIAAPSDYCAAYARDFADAGPRETAVWERRFEDAKTSCVLQFTPQKVNVPQPAAPPRKIKPAKPVSKPVQQAAVVAKKQSTSGKKKVIPDLEPGSDAWLDYCDKKYVSFKRENGTYLSRTGVERKCLVTSE